MAIIQYITFRKDHKCPRLLPTHSSTSSLPSLAYHHPIVPMMISLLLFLSSSIQSLHSCVPTSPGTVPAPITCSQLCPPGLFTVTPPLMDSTSVVGPCSVLTLTCMIIPPYTTATITYNGGSTITVTGSGTATLPMTCNTAGTAWIYMGTPVTSASCAIF